MTDVPGAADFEAALGDLQDHLPGWWATENPDSTLNAVLNGFAAAIDTLAPLYQQPCDDRKIGSAGYDGLIRNFAYALGLTLGELPNQLAPFAAYVQAQLADDGSIASLEAILTLLIMTWPQNLGGSVLTFPLDGSGLTFPADGSGLVLYEYATPPPMALTFPADGSGLTFPADGSGLMFGTFWFVLVEPDPVNRQITVRVKVWLFYSHDALRRTVERYNPADWWPPIIDDQTAESM